MKKIYGLLMVPVLALSGCVSKITKEEGIKRANEIAEHKVDTSNIKALRFEANMYMNFDIVENKARQYMLTDVHSIVEFSREKSFLHTLVKSHEASEYEGTKSDEKSEEEEWYYVKDNVLVSAFRSVDAKGKETKYYTELPSAAAKAFKALLDGTLEATVPELQATEYLTAVSTMLKTTDEEYKEQGAEYKVQAYSGGEGSLVVKGSYTLTKYKGYNGKGSGSVKYAWDNYLLQEINVQMKAEANDEEKKATGSAEIKLQEKVAFRCRVAQPNLKDFAKK